MSKKPTAAMKRALNDIIENVTVTNDEDYQHKHGYLDEYIRQGIPLSFRLAQDHLALPIDQTQADLFAFSELYQTAYAGFDSSDAEQVKQIFNDLADYHIQQSRTDKNRYPEFEYPLEQWMPWEILALLRLRTQKGLDNSMISHPLITPFLPFVSLELGGFFDDAQKKLRRAVFKEFGYQPVVDL